MEDRIDRIDRLMEASTRLSETMLRNQEQLQQNHRVIDANLLLIEQGLLEAWDLLQPLTQAVSVLQAEVVRIDETHA